MVAAGRAAGQKTTIHSRIFKITLELRFPGDDYAHTNHDVEFLVRLGGEKVPQIRPMAQPVRPFERTRRSPCAQRSVPRSLSHGANAPAAVGASHSAVGIGSP